jgi:hypothetical protein
LAEKVFLLNRPQINHLPAAVLGRMGRWFALAAGGSNETELTVGRVDAFVIAGVGIGALDRGIE